MQINIPKKKQGSQIAKTFRPRQRNVTLQKPTIKLAII